MFVSFSDGVVAINFACAKNFGDEIKEKASLYVPTIGKVTTAMLQRNLLRLYKYSAFKVNTKGAATNGLVYQNGTLNGHTNHAITNGTS